MPGKNYIVELTSEVRMDAGEQLMLWGAEK
jgi:hypothetical protein